MKTTRIIVKDGIGREVNPFAGHMAFGNEDWHIFETTVKSYPAPGIEDGEHDCVLQWQEKSPHGNWINVKDPDMTDGYHKRQIWRPSKAESQTNPNQFSKDYPTEYMALCQLKAANEELRKELDKVGKLAAHGSISSDPNAGVKALIDISILLSKTLKP